jgi:hypothetical protein
MSEMLTAENIPARKRGRPKGSKNKPKIAAPVPVPEAMAQFIPESIRNVAPLQPSQAAPALLRPVLTPEGLPNLPEGKIVGRPLGKKNSGPRKPRTSKVEFFNLRGGQQVGDTTVIILEDEPLVLPADSTPST